MTPLLDGWHTGLSAAVWAAGALAGVITATGPWAAATWLLWRNGRNLARTGPAWRIRALLATRRAKRAPN